MTKKTITLSLFCSLLFSNYTTHCMKSLVEIITSKPSWRDHHLKLDFDPRNKDLEAVKLLLEHGVDVNKRGYNYHQTPLHKSLTDCPNMDLLGI